MEELVKIAKSCIPPNPEILLQQVWQETFQVILIWIVPAGNVDSHQWLYLNHQIEDRAQSRDWSPHLRSGEWQGPSCILLFPAVFSPTEFY